MSYVLQHSDDELRRLEAQGAFLEPATRDFLGRVGLQRGMRVLDLGCGAGDVSFLAAELVGSTGEIIGIDRSETALAVAKARANKRGATNVHFLQRELDHLADLQPVDAVICRLVLIHHKNPAEAVSRLVRLVRPGGVLGFQEIDIDARYWSTHRLTMLDKLWAAIEQVRLRGGFTGNLTGAFAEAFLHAGLVDARIIRTGALEGLKADTVYPWLAGFVRTLSNVIAAMGLTLDFDPSTWEQQLKAEVQEQSAVFIPVHFVGAAGRVPRSRPTQ